MTTMSSLFYSKNLECHNFYWMQQQATSEGGGVSDVFC